MAVDFKASYARYDLCCGVAAAATNGVAAGTIHCHSAALVAGLTCFRTGNFILTKYLHATNCTSV
jgi:hypothetical protein